MRSVRPAAVAGLFYPGDRGSLTAMVDGLLAEARDAVGDLGEASPPTALIAPHAGYVYSGPTAALAYLRLEPWREAIRRVVVAGPAHRVPVRGMALTSATAFATPLGEVPVDVEANERLAAAGLAWVDDLAHAEEHSVEVQLPFLQRILAPGWTFVPLVAGASSAAQVADALEPLWGAPGTLVVLSSDLSHYLDIDRARRVDAVTADAIQRRAWEEISGEQACGAVPVRGALELARRHGQHVTLLDLRTSGDTAGDPFRVVGYGAFEIR
jgi:AmmeMemoRadiSam system protein B